MTEIFNTFLVHPIINTLIAIYKLLFLMGVPFAFGFSIIILTVLIRLIIYPLTKAQIQSMQKLQELKPQMDIIKEKYKNDKKRQQAETMQLYRRHGINPAAGCLPLLVQMPIFIALYNVLMQVTKGDIGTIEQINKILYFPQLYLEKAWDVNFLGILLTAIPLSSWNSNPILLTIPLITAFLQFVQSKMMVPRPPAKNLVSKAKSQGDDFQKIMQTQMTYFFPLMIGFFSFSFPVGLSLYWNTFTLFGIIQQHGINRKKAGKD